MIATAALQASTNFLAQLANPAARALALGAAAGLGLAAFRVKATSTCLFTWTAVLYAALAMPFLGWMLPPVSIATPAFLQPALDNLRASEIFNANSQSLVATETQSSLVERNTLNASSPSAAAERRKNAARPERSRTGASRGSVNVDTSKPQGGARSTLTVASNPVSAETTAAKMPMPSSSQRPSIPWTVIASAIYLAVAAIFLVRFSVGLTYGRRLVRRAQTIDDPLVIRKLASGPTVRVAESELISVPVTMGALCPTILLPADWREWNDAKLSAVLAHELSHVARRDPLTQGLSLLHRAIFWFSPLAWFLDRRLADLAEQASDEAALSCGTDRKHYARILLDFFEALHAAPERVWWQGVSMAKAGQAEKRVERILSWKGSVAMHLKKSIAVVLISFAIPVVYLVASAHPAQHVPMPGMTFTQDQTPQPAVQPAPAAKVQPSSTPAPAIASTPEEPPAPEPASSAEPTSAPAPAAGISGGVAGPAPVAPVAPMAAYPPNAALAPITPAPRAYQFYQSDAQARKAEAQAQALALRARAMADQAAHSSYGHGSSYAYGYDDDQRFVIVTGKSDSLTMSGSSADARHVQKLRKSIPGDFIWFQVDEKSYIIRDQATVDRARQLWAPQEELGKKQEELGKQQEALGKQQEELGAKMEKVRVNVPDMTAQLDKLKAELKALGPNATMDQLGGIQEEIGQLQEKMGDIQSHAGEQQGKLGEEMGALGEKQGQLGELQGKLGEQQAELAEKASHEMKLLLEDAVKKGLAQPEL